MELNNINFRTLQFLSDNLSTYSPCEKYLTRIASGAPDQNAPEFPAERELDDAEVATKVPTKTAKSFSSAQTERNIQETGTSQA